MLITQKQHISEKQGYRLLSDIYASWFFHSTVDILNYDFLDVYYFLILSFYTSSLSIHFPIFPSLLHHVISTLLTRSVSFVGGAGDLCLTNDSFIMTLFATSTGLPFIALYFKLKQRQQSSIMARPDLYQRR